MSRPWPALLFASLGCWLVGSQAGATVFVQPINVCDDNGNNCALSTGYAPATSFNELATQLIYANAGVDVQFLAPVKFSSTAFLNPGDMHKADKYPTLAAGQKPAVGIPPLDPVANDRAGVLI